MTVRSMFPYFAAAFGAAALVYAVSFDTPPPADFTFINGTEVQTLDPGQASGVPEGRILNALFEGLMRQDPETLEPIPGIAERYELSPDKKTYTFYLRDDARWTDGTPITAEDFRWSWRRFLHPELAARYAYQLSAYVPGADKFNSGAIEPGDRVEIELADRPSKTQTYPSGTIVKGTLKQIDKPAEPKLGKDADDETKKKAMGDWKKKWIYTVEIDGERRQFAKDEATAGGGIEQCLHVLFDFDEVGIRVLDPRKLEIELNNPTPYFLNLMAFYPMYPVNRACVEKHGHRWTKTENIVTSGPYKLGFRRIRDRIRLEKNEHYWNAENVKLDVIDALAVTQPTTALNMYMKGQADWATAPPNAIVPVLKKRDDLIIAPMLTSYFYRLNTTRPPLDDVRVRRALNLAIDKAEICEVLLTAGQVPALGLVPPGMEGYKGATSGEFNVEEARRLLAEAGYPGGENMPAVEVLYNDLEDHRKIAEKIQQDWSRNLGVKAELRALEWGTYLDTVHQMKYTIARAGWVGDYPDPNTFLDMFVTDGPNNETGWSNEKYDELVLKLAPAESDPARRLAYLGQAEEILMEELPIIPIYFYVSLNMVRPYVKGFYPNVQDEHPLHHLDVDKRAQAQVQ